MAHHGQGKRSIGGNRLEFAPFRNIEATKRNPKEKPSPFHQNQSSRADCRPFRIQLEPLEGRHHRLHSGQTLPCLFHFKVDHGPPRFMLVTCSAFRFLGQTAGQFIPFGLRTQVSCNQCVLEGIDHLFFLHASSEQDPPRLIDPQEFAGHGFCRRKLHVDFQHVLRQLLCPHLALSPFCDPQFSLLFSPIGQPLTRAQKTSPLPPDNPQIETAKIEPPKPRLPPTFGHLKLAYTLSPSR